MTATLTKPYPQPRETPENATYLRGWRSGKLMLQRCACCHRAVFYPRPMCPHCWSDSLLWEEAGGAGTVVSFSLVRRPNHPVFNDEVPIVLAEILLKENVAMLARVLDGTPTIGARVVLASDPETVKRYPLPAFRLVP